MLWYSRPAKAKNEVETPLLNRVSNSLTSELEHKSLEDFSHPADRQAYLREQLRPLRKRKQQLLQEQLLLVCAGDSKEGRQVQAEYAAVHQRTKKLWAEFLVEAKKLKLQASREAEFSAPVSVDLVTSSSMLNACSIAVSNTEYHSGLFRLFGDDLPCFPPHA